MNENTENTVVEIDPETGLPIVREGETAQTEAPEVAADTDATI